MSRFGSVGRVFKAGVFSAAGVSAVMMKPASQHTPRDKYQTALHKCVGTPVTGKTINSQEQDVACRAALEAAVVISKEIVIEPIVTVQEKAKRIAAHDKFRFALWQCHGDNEIKPEAREKACQTASDSIAELYIAQGPRVGF